MAANGSSVKDAVAGVVDAYDTTTRTNVNPETKARAFAFLEQFQKSVCPER
jgi:hypothetical protein